MFCRSLFVLFYFWSLCCTDSDCPFGVVGLSLMDIAFRGSLLTPQNSENKNIANMNSFTVCHQMDDGRRGTDIIMAKKKKKERQ